MKLPVGLIQSLQNCKGFSEEAFVSVHTSGEQVTSVRLKFCKTVFFAFAGHPNLQAAFVMPAADKLCLACRPCAGQRDGYVRT